MEKILYCLVLKNKTRKHPKYYLRIREKGHRDKLLPLGTSSRPEAELKLRAAQRTYEEACDLEKQGLPVPPELSARIVRVDSVAVMTGGAGRGPMTVREAVEEWETWLRVKGMSEKTIVLYTHGVLRVLVDGNLPVTSVDRAAVTSGMARKASLSSAGRRSLSVILKNFLEWLNENHGGTWGDAVKACPQVKAVSSHKVAFSDDEIRRILSAIHHIDPETNAQAQLFFNTMAATGCRVSELRELQWEYFLPDRIIFKATTTKSRKERVVPVNRKIQELAANLREASGEVFSLLPGTNAGLNMMLRRAMEKAGVDKKGSLHSFRASLATRWARQGIPVKATQQLLGHSSPSTTLSYYVEQDSMDALRQYVEDGDLTRW